MNSFKSFSSILYVFSYGLFILISLIGGLFVVGTSYLIISSENVLMIQDMVIYHKIILILFLVLSLVLALGYLFEYLLDTVFTEFDYDKFFKVITRNLILSIIGFVLIILYYQYGSHLGISVQKNLLEMNVLATLTFVIIFDLSNFLIRSKELFMNIFMFVLLSILLGIKYFELRNGDFPVEFSSISYIVVPIVFLLHIKRFYIVAAYAGVMAGFFYYIYIIANGGNTYYVISGPIVLRSMFGHGVLLLTGLVALKKFEFKRSDIYRVIIFVASCVVWAIIFRPDYIWFRLFIYELIDGDYILYFENEITKANLALYYVFVVLFMGTTMGIFLKLNSVWLPNKIKTV